MASLKFKGFTRKNSTFGLLISSLRKENVYLKKTLVEMCRQHSEHNKLVERFLSLESARLEGGQQHKEGKVSPSEQPRDEEGKVMDVVSMRRERSISSLSRETEEIKNKLVSVLTKCQYLENKVAQKDFASEASASTTAEFRDHLADALEKNKQWLEYDQQREAYMRATLARMLWLEKQLNEANQALSEQHNKDHSAERERLSQMQEHYERLLERAKDELEVLREKLDVTHQHLIAAQNWGEEKEREVEGLKQQLQSEDASRRRSVEDDHCSEDGELWLSAEVENLQDKLDEEKRRSASFQLQSELAQKCLLNRHHADQEKIADLERQIKISSQDLEDEKQNCVFLNNQMLKLLKTLQKHKDQVTKQPKEEQQDCDSCEVSPSCSSPGSSLNESFLECPSCHAKYPACHYRDLMSHLETCID